MTNTPIEISNDLARRLVQAQFPQWASLEIHAVAQSGWDNCTFRLGEDLVVRLPRAIAYARQVHREQRWLPFLAPRLSLPIPAPVALGEPQFGYPWKWSVYWWITGDTALPERIADPHAFARHLAAFLRSLHSVPSEGGPVPGPENFHRGGSLAVYDLEARDAMAILSSRLNAEALTVIWQAALASEWVHAPVWVHGDIAVGNLLVVGGRLCGVIDFGQSCVGDPACDLAPAWTLFDAESRKAFREGVPLDEATWARGRGWALWKALIVAARLTDTNAWEGSRCWNTIENVLLDHTQTAAPLTLRGWEKR